MEGSTKTSPHPLVVELTYTSVVAEMSIGFDGADTIFEVMMEHISNFAKNGVYACPNIDGGVIRVTVEGLA